MHNWFTSRMKAGEQAASNDSTSLAHTVGQTGVYENCTAFWHFCGCRCEVRDFGHLTDIKV